MERAIELFVLTRFAIRPDLELEIFPKATERSLYTDRSWLEARITRMAKFTIPSIAAQTDSDFTWLIGLDRSVPKEIVEKLAKALPQNASILRSSSTTNFNEAVSQFLRERGENQITVRLDSDDALCRQFVETAKKVCVRDGVIYNFTRGMGYFEDLGLAVNKWIRSSPFIAVRGTPDLHVLVFGLHSVVGEQATLKEIATLKPFWLKVYGSEMTSNLPINGFATVRNPNSILARRFGVRIALQAPSMKHRFWFTYSFVGRLLGRRYPLLLKTWRKVSRPTSP